MVDTSGKYSKVRHGACVFACCDVQAFAWFSCSHGTCLLIHLLNLRRPHSESQDCAHRAPRETMCSVVFITTSVFISQRGGSKSRMF